MDFSSSNDEDSTQNTLVCAYCGEFVNKLVPKRKYCFTCKDKCLKECSRCHLPYDDARFYENEDARRCISCQKRLERERAKRKAGEKVKKIGKSVRGAENKLKQKKKDVKPEDTGYETDIREQVLNPSESTTGKQRKIGYIPIFM